MVTMIQNITSKLTMPTMPTMPRLASSQQIMKNITVVALPLIAFVGLLYSPQKVEAGPLLYCSCVAAITVAGGVVSGGAFVPMSAYAAGMFCASLALVPGP